MDQLVFIGPFWWDFGSTKINRPTSLAAAKRLVFWQVGSLGWINLLRDSKAFQHINSIMAGFLNGIV